MEAPLNIDKAVDIAKPYSKCPRPRLKARAEALVRIWTAGIEGDIVECGVWQGGGVILARLLLPERICWMYDTFSGMANRCKHDRTHKGFVMPEGKSAASLVQVAANLEKTKTLDLKQMRIVIGKVEDTLPIEEHCPEKIAFLHLDTDWYHSTKIELEVLWPRLQPNGIMIVDDYGHWHGAKKAVNNYFALLGWPIVRRQIDMTALLMVKDV